MNIRLFFRRTGRAAIVFAAFHFLCDLRALHGNAGKYESIIVRNPFALMSELPTPPKSEEAPKPPAPPPHLILTGITKYKGSEKAYLVDPAGRSYEEKFLVFSPGTRNGNLVLTEIDWSHRRVRLDYQNQEIWLSMKENDMASFLAKPRVGGEPQSLAYANVRQRRVPRSTILAAVVPKIR